MKKIFKKYEQLETAITLLLKSKEELQKEFIFAGFGLEIPRVAFDGDLQIGLVYDTEYMSIETALGYMEEVGFITPDNFYGLGINKIVGSSDEKLLLDKELLKYSIAIALREKNECPYEVNLPINNGIKRILAIVPKNEYGKFRSVIKAIKYRKRYKNISDNYNF